MKEKMSAQTYVVLCMCTYGGFVDVAVVVVALAVSAFTRVFVFV